MFDLQPQKKGLGSPSLGCSGSPDLGYAYQNSGKCINCCAMYQGMHYLDYTNSDNPDEATVHDRLMKELVGIVLAQIDQGMFNLPNEGVDCWGVFRGQGC